MRRERSRNVCPIHCNAFVPDVTFLEPTQSTWKRGSQLPLDSCQCWSTCFLSNLKSPTCILTVTRRKGTNKTYIYTNFWIYLCTFFGLGVCDLQVAVPGSELLPAHDLLLQVRQRDVRPVKNHRVVAEFGGELIVNMSHAGNKRRALSWTGRELGSW